MKPGRRGFDSLRVGKLLTEVRIRLSALRRIIREEAGKRVYGWPVADVEHVYGVPDKMADTHPTDLGNLRLPKGANSRDDAEDRPLDQDIDKSKAPSYGKQRGVSTKNRSNNDNGRGGGGGG